MSSPSRENATRVTPGEARERTHTRSASPARLLLLLPLTAALVGAWCLAYFGPTGIRQQRWMGESRAVLPAVESRLAADDRFAGVTAFVSTGCNVVVHGAVASEQAARDVRAALAGIAFPHGVLYLVRVQ